MWVLVQEDLLAEIQKKVRKNVKIFFKKLKGYTFITEVQANIYINVGLKKLS